MQIPIGQKPICGNNLHICVYGCEIKEMSQIAHYVYILKPEDHWSCIAHLSAEDMLKLVVIEEKK